MLITIPEIRLYYWPRSVVVNIRDSGSLVTSSNLVGAVYYKYELYLLCGIVWFQKIIFQKILSGK